MLVVNKLTAGYEGLPIVRGVDITVPDGQIVSLIGANGVGKSTTLKAITGLIKTMEGQVLFDDQDITNLSTSKICELGISMIPEGRQLFPTLTVSENLDVGSTLKKNRVKRSSRKEYVYNIFPRLKERESQLAGTLSGGEQQMVATGRALMSNPKLLILDEPTWGLAPMLVTELFEVIQTIVTEESISILLVEQTVGRALEMSDWAYVLENGSVAMEGTGKELLNNKKLKEVYMGM
jgi:branched-chain amino acid transport system ATP-binding protein